MPMVIKLGRVVTFLEDLQPIKPYDPLITWYCEIMCQTKPSYFHHHNPYGHQTWQGGDIHIVGPPLLYKGGGGVEF